MWWIVALVVASPLPAETLWLEPDPIAPEAGQPVRLRLMAGEHFRGKERSLDTDAVASFQRLRKNARENLALEEGAKPVASYTSGGDGVEIVSLSWKEAGGSYFCKAVHVVGDAEPGHPLRYSELGQRLEIVPQTDPVTLRRGGGELQVQVLYEREPLAGVRLVAMPEAAPVEGALGAVTDEIGLASFDLDRGGIWLVEVNYKSGGKRSLSTLLMEAAAP